MAEEWMAGRGRGAGLWSNVAAAAVLAPMTFVIVVVNYWIYRARSEFIELHPAFSAAQPPTISKAISDPTIGEPFAVWITCSAVLLAFGVLPILWLYERSARALPAGQTRRIVATGIRLAIVSQVVACVGMVVLSHYRSPGHGDEHMIGSYIFFIAQAMAVLWVGVICRAIARDQDAASCLGRPGFINPRMSRVRSKLAFFAVGLAFAFLALYVAKGFEFEYGYDAMYIVYVLSEPALISSFLLVFATYYPELLLAVRNVSAASRRPISAWQMPD